MSYTNLDTSAHDAAPEDLYLFEAHDEVYAYTSAAQSISHDEQLYTPDVITRSSDEGGGRNARGMTIDMPSDSPLVRRFALGQPAGILDVTITQRLGAQAASVVFVGRVISMTLMGASARLKCLTDYASCLEDPLPSFFFQRGCNHALYSLACKVDRTKFAFQTSIESINAQMLRVVDAGPNPSGWFAGGEAVSVKHERRAIFEHTGQDIYINAPFTDIRVGETITLYAGCNHSVAACRDKFRNIVNYGGFPQIPIVNPFKSGLE